MICVSREKANNIDQHMRFWYVVYVHKSLQIFDADIAISNEARGLKVCSESSTTSIHCVFKQLALVSLHICPGSPVILV